MGTVTYLFKKLFPGNKPANRLTAGNNDELIGVWENDGDDGSGLHAIWGWALEFKQGGTGVYYYWNSTDENARDAFLWERIGEKQMRIKWLDSEQEWNAINYTINHFDGPYGSKYWKLTDDNFVPIELANEGFWEFFGALYKIKK